MVLGQNKSFHLSQWLKYSCEYLTCKEWKLQCSHLCLDSLHFSEYLTYKEWKQVVVRLATVVEENRKYLTYKEWKLHLLSYDARFFGDM